MTRRHTSLKVAGLCCILCPSLGMLAATYYNRSGRADSALQLTQRELRLPQEDLDSADDALTLSLIWRVEGMGHTDLATQDAATTPVRWMTAEKSAQLGVKSVADLRWRASVPAYLVLEFNGPTYAHELEQACRNGASATCADFRNLESRLYVIDAGPDADLLRREYPDPAVYAVVHGVVAFAAAREGTGLAATMGGLDVETIQAVEPLRSGKTGPAGDMTWHVLGRQKEFVAEIDFGRRDEPWDRSLSFAPQVTQPP